MQRKVVYFNHFFSVFCKLQCYENKNKKYKNNGDRSQAKGESSIRQTPLPNCQYARSCVYVYEVLLGSSIFRPSSYFAEEILVY